MYKISHKLILLLLGSLVFLNLLYIKFLKDQFNATAAITQGNSIIQNNKTNILQDSSKINLKENKLTKDNSNIKQNIDSLILPNEQNSVDEVELRRKISQETSVDIPITHEGRHKKSQEISKESKSLNVTVTTNHKNDSSAVIVSEVGQNIGEGLKPIPTSNILLEINNVNEDLPSTVAKIQIQQPNIRDNISAFLKILIVITSIFILMTYYQIYKEKKSKTSFFDQKTDDNYYLIEN
jgi:hypothetical protein